MAALQPQNSELAAALRKFTQEESFFGDRSQRVLVISSTANGYEVSARLSPAEVRKGAHLSRVREMRESPVGVEAIIHINLRGTSAALICILEDGMSVYRLRPQKPPRGWRWVPLTDRMRERWDEVWGRL